MKKGWSGEPYNHSLASKGISTKYRYNAKGSPKLSVGLPPYMKERIKYLTELAEEGKKEWIAELTLINGNIIIDDIQVSKKVDSSFLRWNQGDEINNIGYIHYHPANLIPEFSAQDFTLAINVHNLRKNKKGRPYTIMGLVHPDKKVLKTILYGIKPSKKRLAQFDGLVAVESDMRDIIEDMERRGELIRMNEVTR